MTQVTLHEALNSEPYPVIHEEKYSGLDHIWYFNDGHHDFKLHFEKQTGLGKKVFRVMLGQKTPNVHGYKKIIGKFSDPMRTISTLIFITSVFLELQAGKAFGLAYALPVATLGNYSKLVTKVVGMKLKTRLTLTSLTYQPAKAAEEGLEYIYFAVKPHGESAFDGKWFQEQNKPVDHEPKTQTAAPETKLTFSSSKAAAKPTADSHISHKNKTHAVAFSDSVTIHAPADAKVVSKDVFEAKVRAAIMRNRGNVQDGSTNAQDYGFVTTSDGSVYLPIRDAGDNVVCVPCTSETIESIADLKNVTLRIGIPLSNLTMFHQDDVTFKPVVGAVDHVLPPSIAKAMEKYTFAGAGLANEVPSYSAPNKDWLTKNPPASINNKVIVDPQINSMFVNQEISIMDGLGTIKLKDYTGGLVEIVQKLSAQGGTTAKDILSDVTNAMSNQGEMIYDKLLNAQPALNGANGVTAIAAYTGSKYRVINNFLRGEMVSDFPDAASNVSSIDKLFNSKGIRLEKSIVVYRGQRMQTSIVENILKGKPYVMRGYTSASSAVRVALSFGKMASDGQSFIDGGGANIESDKYNCLFSIVGLDKTLSLVVGGVSQHTNEREIVLNRGTIIRKVDGGKVVKKGSTYIIPLEVVDTVNPVMVEGTSFGDFKDKMAKASASEIGTANCELAFDIDAMDHSTSVELEDLLASIEGSDQIRFYDEM